MRETNFDKYPEKSIEGFPAIEGWESIRGKLREAAGRDGILVAEFYPGVHRQELVRELGKLDFAMFDAESCAVSDAEYQRMTADFVTEDRVFGVMNTLRLEDVYRQEKLEAMSREIAACDGPVLVYGTGASLVTDRGTLLYFDMPRWEIQCRFAQGMKNWKTDNESEEKLRKFKRGFFLEWRMADRRKKELFERMDYALDTVIPGSPKMVSGQGVRTGLDRLAREPFRLVPYYAPEVWGGQWMKEVCGLDRGAKNFAWAFDGVPEENSIFLRFGEVRMEFPAVDVVFYRPRPLLGDRVHGRFGDEFPIRFDFLDTMGGQNLSLQVHPLTEYIQNTFGMHYTQDESYYILDCDDDAVVYLGLKEGVCKEEMLAALHEAQEGGKPFDAGRFVNQWPAKKHDHFLIPAGTIHCSGSNCMVLEISATPYIFTFKLWDWGRLGLDGRPRPVHLQHGEKVIQWDRTTGWVRDNLVRRAHVVEEEEGFCEEFTGLHEQEFLETRRDTLQGEHTFTGEGSVQMCNVVDGQGAVIASPEGAFAEFTVHYAETFIIPASIGAFTIRPLGEECKILRAYVR
jgi:mannose-6-phosphate isomerase class I|nr:class I mannose-6-phosphate isomerase [uncultured Acetatifactor sp.]